MSQSKSHDYAQYTDVGPSWGNVPVRSDLSSNRKEGRERKGEGVYGVGFLD